jgi:putative membrane protein (TIGR04086 family)
MFEKNKSRIKYLLKGVLVAFIITIIALIFFSLILRVTSLRESKLTTLNNITMILSVAIGSFYTAVKIRENGWLNGAIVGALYYLIIILLNIVIIRPETSNMYLFIKLLISTVAGFIGGMLGINLT